MALIWKLLKLHKYGSTRANLCASDIRVQLCFAFPEQSWFLIWVIRWWVQCVCGGVPLFALGVSDFGGSPLFGVWSLILAGFDPPTTGTTNGRRLTSNCRRLTAKCC